MRLRQLFKIQNIIDNEIRDFCQRDGEMLDRPRLLKTQILALEVKTADLANFTKCYKYQRTKVQLKRESLILKYIHCFEFLLSIGNNHRFNTLYFDVDKLLNMRRTDNLVDLFLSLFEKINTLKKDLLEDKYILSIVVYTELLKDYLWLCNALGLTFDEICDHYDKIYRDIMEKTGD